MMMGPRGPGQRRLGPLGTLLHPPIARRRCPRAKRLPLPEILNRYCKYDLVYH
ncbi:unnamed protein product [Meloidogyne enterolobii]|uniref:Uncharacterized protein n=1 Tax=Meloidogyne enterolobii TaxID=390850 RepID=A0ACB0Y6R8_MELEN